MIQRTDLTEHQLAYKHLWEMILGAVATKNVDFPNLLKVITADVVIGVYTVTGSVSKTASSLSISRTRVDQILKEAGVRRKDMVHAHDEAAENFLDILPDAFKDVDGGK